MPWGAVIAGVATLAGAYISSQSANKAADAQTAAAEQSLALQQQMFYQTRADLSPWTMVGTNALYQLSDALGVSRPLSMPGSGTSSSSLTPGMQAALAYNSGDGGAGIFKPLDWLDWTGKAGNTLEQIFGGNNRSAIGDIWGALQEGKPISDESWAKAGYGPGGTALPGSPTSGTSPTGVMSSLGLVNATGGNAAAPAGVTTTGSATGTGMTPAKTFQTSPGYQFAFEQGVKAVDAGAATQGLLGSGARLKALTSFGQGLANQEYWNYLNQLSNLATAGQNSAAQTGTFGANYANAASNIFGAKGNAQAANAAAQGNIWGETVGNLAPLFGNWAAGNYGSSSGGYYPWSGSAGTSYQAPYTMNWG